jgi:predicted nuclease of predicted toxin-antitoxin system
VRFLADESCDHAVVRALRKAGHTVEAISETSPRAGDADVLKRAVRAGVILLTEDRDFGRLVFAEGQATRRVVLLRFPASARTMLGDTIVGLVRNHGDRLAGRFVVVEPGRVRISPDLTEQEPT